LSLRDFDAVRVARKKHWRERYAVSRQRKKGETVRKNYRPLFHEDGFYILDARETLALGALSDAAGPKLK
jgi:hypothetical protein